MVIFAKAENALKRAEELVNVGQKQAGLQVLHDVITSKRYRTWQKTLESIMFKYVELCVDMRRGRFAKDGLIQYRIVCQQVNVGSLEEVVKYFLRLSTEKVKQAQAKVQASEIALDVEDLEAEKRPEDLMMSFVSGEKGKDRSDKEVVTPWFKFLWETYRIVLDILRNNSKLEALYAMTAHRAFQFCLQYKRTTEFRRLCEIIRNHLSNLNKYKDQRDRPDLALPESLQLYLDTRIEQLKVATELELWQEAFRSIEDIHGLMCMVKKTPKPQMMAVYYTKLSKIFWVAESHLYHAYAWYKLYTLQKSYNKNLTQKDLQLMASNVLLAALSVMPYDQKHGTSRFAVEKEKERTLKMANLLGFNLDSKKDANEELSRSALLSELVSKGLMSYVPQEVRDLYHLLEKESHPLDLAAKVEPLLVKLSKISDKLSAASPVPEALLEQYVPALERLTALRVLQQTSEVYQTMKISALKSMIPFFDFTVFEKLCAEGARFNFVQIKIDHLNGVVLFGKKNLESDNIKYQLTVLAERLNKARLLINLPSKKQNKITDTTTLLQTIEKEHKKLLARKLLIEKRKEEQERQMLEKEREEETKRLQIQRMTEEAEQKRLHAEAIRRQEMRIKKEIEEKEQQEVQDIIHEQEKKKGKKSKKSGIEGEKLVSKKDVIEQVLNEQLKERQERERKLQKLAKTMDYLERAKREEEGPLIEAAYQKRLVEDKIFFEQQQEQAIEQSKLQHAADLAEKNRLMRMMDNKAIFQEEIVSRRKGEFERLKRERESRLAERRAVRKLDRERRRKMEYYRRQEEEKLRKQKEEEEARKKEVEERKRREEAERTAKLNEMAEKQRMRELEIEERARQRETQAREQAAAETSRPQKFVPRHLLRQSEAVAVPVAQEAATDSWRDRRPVVPRDNDVNVSPAPDRNAPPRARYEPPSARSEPFRAPRDNPPGARPAAPGRGREDRAFGSGFGARDDRGFGGRGGFGGRDDRGFGSSDRWRGANDRDKQRDEPGSSSWRK